MQQTKEKGRKGQLTILSLMAFFMLMAVFVILLKPLQSFIDLGVNATAGMSEGSTVAMILNFTPVLIALTIIISLFISISIYRAQ